MEINALARRQIAALADRLLRDAGVAGVIPTPLDQLSKFAGLKEVIDIGELPEELAAAKPKAWRRILGALLYRADTAFVDFSQVTGRARFTQAHEITHRALPWHARAYHLDDEARLFRDTECLLELEANFGAAQLLFQGNRFHNRALDYQTSIRTPIALAEDFDASIHATIRYYVEHHPEPLAALVTGRYRRFDGTVPTWSSVESPSFRSRFGRLADFLPGGEISLGENNSPLAFGKLAREAMTAVDPPAETVQLTDLAGKTSAFTAEAFFNQRCLFVMVSARHLVRLGRRLQLAAR